MGIASTIRHPSRIFYGWRMLAVLGAMAALNHAFYLRGSTLFLIPVQTTLDLSRAATS